MTQGQMIVRARAFKVLLVIGATALGAAGSETLAAFLTVQNIPVQINGSLGNKADFGSGGHSGGLPTGSGNVKWEYDNAAACLTAKATVTGKVYLDDFFGGQVRVTIQYRDATGAIITNGQVTFVSPNMPFAALGAADSSHQMTISHTFQAANLKEVTIITSNSGKTSGMSATVGNKRFLIRLNSPAGVGLGGGGYTCTQSGCTGPVDNATFNFTRFDEEIIGSLQAVLYYAGESASKPKFLVEWLNRDGNSLGADASQTSAFLAVGGSNPNSRLNQQSISDLFARFSSCRLWKARVTVGVDARGSFESQVSRTLSFEAGTSVGTFDLAPTDVTVDANETADYAFTWSVPDPLSWHDLDFLQLHVRNGDDILMSLVFDEARQTFALLDEDTGDLGQAYAAGSRHRLETRKAALDLSQTSVVGSGPTGQSVTLNLSLSFKPQAVGARYVVEVAATDDEGNQGSFEPAGMLTVR